MLCKQRLFDNQIGKVNPMRTQHTTTIQIEAGVDLYHTVLFKGEPNGAFYYQARSKLWQGITRANRLLTPTPSRDDCIAGVIDAIGE